MTSHRQDFKTQENEIDLTGNQEWNTVKKKRDRNSRDEEKLTKRYQILIKDYWLRVLVQ